MHRSLSFVVPSGHLTLGNYLGAIRQWVAGQDSGALGIYGVADLHALTVEHDPLEVARLTREQVATLLAVGIDPERSVVFVQSHNPAHTELHWLLEATAHDGELRRMIQYKEKSAREPTVRASLLAYPILMAADILLYDVASVPVGDDQRQHLELARDLAMRFNNAYGQTFVVPQAATARGAARVMDLQDPMAKMNKSAPIGARGVVRLLDSPDVIRTKFKGSRTDSGSDVVYDPPHKPGVANLLEILAVCRNSTPDDAAATLSSYQELKEACAESVIEILAPVQLRFAEIADDDGYLQHVLRSGAQSARELAAPTLARAKASIGLYPLDES